MNPCEICGKPVPDYVPQYCCSGDECGCLGLPIEPCVCGDACWAALTAVRRCKAELERFPLFAEEKPRQLEIGLDGEGRK